jgi:hypothetical protein
MRQRAFMCAMVGLLPLSCGGRTLDEGDPLERCGVATACGGDLSGTWDVNGYCLGQAAQNIGIASEGVPDECLSMIQEASEQSVVDPTDLTVTFESGIYRFGGTGRIATTYRYTQDCVGALAPGVELDAHFCALLEDQFSARPSSEGACSFAGSVCHCSVDLEAVFDSVGSYETVGTSIRFDSESTGAPYCVRGNTAVVDAESQGLRGRLALER